MPSLKNQESLKNLIEKFKSMDGMILTEYHGLKVSDISDLRNKLRQYNSDFFVAKNTLSEIALKGMGVDIGNNFQGPVAIVFQKGDIVATSKVVVEFAKTHEKLKVRSAYLDGKFVGADTVERLSSIPSKEILMYRMVSSLNAPISGFVNVLAANIRGVVNVLNAISKKQSA